MKKFVVALVALMFLLVVACGDSGTNKAEGTPQQKEYAVEFETLDYARHEEVICHKETGVCYLVVYSASHGRVGVTVMLNPDGSPYVMEVTPDE